MESFCEEPRSAPVPYSVERIYTAPVVPDASLIMLNNNDHRQNAPIFSKNHYDTYRAWKQSKDLNSQNKTNTPRFQTTNLQGNNHSFRKQVRFESPVVHDRYNENFKINSAKDKLSAFNSSQQRQEKSVLDLVDKPCSFPKALSNPTVSKPFAEIYMANIPSRHLDLSILEPPKRADNLENINPRINNQANLNRLNKGESFGLDKCKPFKKVENNVFSERKVLGNLDDNVQKSYNFNNKNPDNLVIDLYNYNYEDFKDKTIGHSDTNCLQFQCDYGLNNHAVNVKECSNNCDDYRPAALPKKVDEAVQTQESAICLPQNKPDEPTVKDLLQIMKQQNEQLLILQKQVATLLENQDTSKKIEASTSKQIESPPEAVSLDNQKLMHNKYLTSTRYDGQLAQMHNTPQKRVPTKNNLAQYSIDVMTSFEVSIRPQVNHNRLFKEQITHEPKLQEITEMENNSFEKSGKIFDDIKNGQKLNDTNDSLRNTDVSLALNTPVNVPEECHSPEHSIHVDMQDYSSDSEDDNSTDIGWTFYNNLMGQVNNILKKTAEGNVMEASQEDFGVLRQRKSFKSSTVQKVKEATIKHLKSIGINVPEGNGEESSLRSEDNYSPTEVSFAVKQLLMKYMPDDHLAKVTCKQKQPLQENFIKRRPEFSFATVQYMQKYNLLATDPSNKKSAPKFCPTAKTSVPTNGNKILDITALKQQPKLM